VRDYADYTQSFVVIRDERIRQRVDEELEAGLLWPHPIVQLNPAFEPGGTIDDLVDEGLLHERCRQIFRRNKTPESPEGEPLRLHRHQREAIEAAGRGGNYVLTTGTGSGKSLAYIVPIVDHVLRAGTGRGIQALVVYPMNALANSQLGELEKFLSIGPPGSTNLVSYRRYTGQESQEEREEILRAPPDILLTNYVMLEYILTRPFDSPVIKAAQGLRFLVLDELHTYRGRQGADVALLARRVREACNANAVQHVGTSATLAGAGTLEEQRREVARTASLVFGDEVEPENVIGETLRRATTPAGDDPDALRARIDADPPTDYEAFLTDPLASWIETTLGLMAEPETGRLVRATPLPVHGEEGAAARLAALTGLSTDECAAAIERTLMQGYRIRHPDTGFPIFAFRLHQFFSRGETVYASLEREDARFASTEEQQYVPGDRSRALFPLAFCRECGQEYYTVRTAAGDDGATLVVPRHLNDTTGDDETDAGFLYVGSDKPWPNDLDAALERIPEEWLEPRGDSFRVKQNYRQYLPRAIALDPTGAVDDDGLACHWVPAPFRFCLHCGVSYGPRRADFGKLLMLGAGGRSSATTILGLAAIRTLREDTADPLPREAQKLLSFTDNRQDASLQSGHFNDFVEVGLIRSALYRAALAVGEEGLSHDELTLKVFEELALPIELYASQPEAAFAARRETDRTLRDVLGYRLYRDLERGWRITAPNLEQAGLLEIDFEALDEVCAAEEVWAERHQALATTTLERREEIARTLLDYMRRELAIDVDYLDADWQEQLKQRSNQSLVEPWGLEEDEQPLHARVLFPKPRRRAAREYRGDVYVSARGGFGQYLGRPQTLGPLSLEEKDAVIRDLLEALVIGGHVRRVAEPADVDDVPGYQLAASAMRWRAGDGTRSAHDPIRVPSPPTDGARTNPYFVDFYREVAAGGQGIQAREHTAQVPADEREEREKRFRTGDLPVLFCSPTMELGVDIAELNVVNMRNVPPTPANYAQRSGRAGRSGQPAFVFNYCAAGNSHDQYFFRRPQLMVSGQVKPPRLDLTNEDLVRAHVHAIWVAESGVWLGSSLAEILELDEEDRTFPLRESKREQLADPSVIGRARPRAERMLARIPGLVEAEWYSETWLDETLQGAVLDLDRACERWRGLYRAAIEARESQHAIILDQSRSPAARGMARRLRAEAEAQIELLRGGDDNRAWQSDFYSYRYFASEGFLPGYSFPRLPLSAFIPARRGRQGRDEFLQRPRFLAISEFGPRSIVYHEGSRYLINRVFLPAERTEENRLPTASIKHCMSCGYLHPMADGDPGLDMCEQCGAPLDVMHDLFRLQNVATRRRDRINSDEEERVRLGFEIRTGIRFARRDGETTRVAHIASGGTAWGKLTYGGAATLWRINVGWTRRRNPNQLGFRLDTERGYWARNEQAALEDPEDPMSPSEQRVIPYVEDRRNALLFEPSRPLGSDVMASLAAALKNAIQVVYDLEDSELAVEPLPSRDFRRQLLFYEAAEGGAGVLRLLATQPEALPRVAREALEICHFDPDTGEDRQRAPRAREDCTAACYDCLLSYANQSDHRLVDRHLVRDLLLILAGAGADVDPAPAPLPRHEHLAQLRARCDSGLERRFLDFLEEHDLELPTHAQARIERLRVKPDFTYATHHLVVFVDGPPHDYADVEERDGHAASRLEDDGYTVVRFRHDEDWAQIIARYPSTFGRLRSPA
jgi:very-short-patch-repair endonuclease